MSHVVESAASRRHRRNRRTAIILVILIAALAGAFYYAASYMNRPSAPLASGCPTGDFTAGAQGSRTLGPGQITVNVYNATTRAGLAADTAKTLKGMGFVVGSVSNDPLKKKIDGIGELRYGPNGQNGATIVQATLPGSANILDTRADATVDLVLGNGYKAMATPTATGTPTVPNPC